MQRRDLLKMAAILAGFPAFAGCERMVRFGIPLSLVRPGMAAGHRLRSTLIPPPTNVNRQTQTVIVGSGVAGLFAAWRLKRAGYSDFLILNGPEPDGNASCGYFGEYGYPTGAHYLPLPSRESYHVRELLAEIGIIEGSPYAKRPIYAETALVHPPDERLWLDGHWQEGLWPQRGIGSEALSQQHQFLAYIAWLKQQHGEDGRRVFAIPLALSSRDPNWTALDKQSFADWLTTQGYTASSLRWYLNYCCRDDYGCTLEQTSAWAGLHYFASREGLAANADEGSVLTWPDGLAPLLRHMRNTIGSPQQLSGFAWRIRQQGKEVSVDYLDAKGNQRLLAKRIILATPLYVSTHLLGDQLAKLGFDATQHLPSYAPWLVSNFLLHRFPSEAQAFPLAWDNVVYGSQSLGYVVSTHQLIRSAKPAHSVFTTYHAFAFENPTVTRKMLETCEAEKLFSIAVNDLLTVYGWRWRQSLQEVKMTARGHAMAQPRPGFLSNKGLHALRAADGAFLFAHSDLSGLSLFEEAAWWGERAARQILGETR